MPGKSIDVFKAVLINIGVLGVGKTKIDNRWRITLPVGARGRFKPGDEVVVEECGEMILTKKALDPLKEFMETKLYIRDKELDRADTSEAKHVYGAVKD